MKNIKQNSNISTKSYIALLIIGGVVGIGAYMSSMHFLVSEEVVSSKTGYHLTTILEKPFFDEAFEEATDFGDKEEARVLILPHHLVARPLIAGALEAQAKVKSPKTIVIVGPDHLGRSKGMISTTDLQWRTPYGFMHPDTGLVSELIDDYGVTLEPEVFDEEHSIAAIIPFLHKTWPKAKIVPLHVKEDLDPLVSQRIADMLADDMVMLVASVDFSHYLSSEVSFFHDEKSINAIMGRDYTELPNLEIDSSASLRFAFDFAEQTSTEKFDLYINENSNSFFGYPIEETTGYVVGGFVTGIKEQESQVTILSVGDMMFDRGVKDNMKKHGDQYPFEKIRGAEDRFFRGVDIILGNLEGAISKPLDPIKQNDFAFGEVVGGLLGTYNFSAVNLANNHSIDQGQDGYENTVSVLAENIVGHFGHQTIEDSDVWKTEVGGKKVVVVGVNTIEQDYDENSALAKVKKESSDSDITIVQIHWGDEFSSSPNDFQMELGRSLVDSGADVVLGHHPHVLQGMEVYKNSPIFWSLGNFIFDQDDVEETDFGITVGLTILDEEMRIRIFPISINNSQPDILIGKEKENILGTFSILSDIPDYMIDSVKNGLIIIEQ
jgi:gamma-polyglutamate biosynthesis protein CapA